MQLNQFHYLVFYDFNVHHLWYKLEVYVLKWCFEALTHRGVQSKTRMRRSLIFLHSWKIACQSISLTPNSHTDIRINAFNVFKRKRDRNALFTIFYLENLLSHIAVLAGMTSIFCHHLMKFGQFVFHSKEQPYSDNASWMSWHAS